MGKNSNSAGNVWWNTDCEEAILYKKHLYKTWLRNSTDFNHNEMKRAKIHCNRIVAQAKRQYWSEYCKIEVNDPKDLQKVWRENTEK